MGTGTLIHGRAPGTDAHPRGSLDLCLFWRAGEAPAPAELSPSQACSPQLLPSQKCSAAVTGVLLQLCCSGCCCFSCSPGRVAVSNPCFELGFALAEPDPADAVSSQVWPAGCPSTWTGASREVSAAPGPRAGQELLGVLGWVLLWFEGFGVPVAPGSFASTSAIPCPVSAERDLCWDKGIFPSPCWNKGIFLPASPSSLSLRSWGEFGNLSFPGRFQSIPGQKGWSGRFQVQPA